MGLLTTITFRNDCWEDLKRDPERTMNMIRDAMNGSCVDGREMIAQTPVHSGDSAVYVVSGNTAIDVSSYGTKEKQFRETPTFMRQVDLILSGHAKDFRQRLQKFLGK